MENKNIEFSVDHREYQMALIMNLPNNTPKAAMKVICEIQKERDFLLEQNEQLKDTIDRDSGCEENARLRKENEKLKKEHEKLKENQLTEDSAMDYIYQHSNQYESWIEGSDLYKKLKEENEELNKLKDQIERERYEHKKALMNQEDKTFLGEIKPLEDQVETLHKELEDLKYWRDHECESPWEAIVMIKELTDENKKLQNYSGCHPPPQMKL